MARWMFGAFTLSFVHWIKTVESERIPRIKIRAFLNLMQLIIEVLRSESMSTSNRGGGRTRYCVIISTQDYEERGDNSVTIIALVYDLDHMRRFRIYQILGTKNHLYEDQ